jgi:hypothetical protein
MTWARVSKLGCVLPEVVEDTWYRTPALKVRGKGFARLKEDGASVMFRVADLDEQEFLVETRGATYFMTDHYRGYAAVLARLATLTDAECRARLEGAWRATAPAALVRTRDG